MSNEDTITKSIFALLKKLTDDTLTSILNGLISGDLDHTLTEPKFEFQPRWCAENTENKVYVEPDVFISSKEIDIIIEAKKDNKNYQRKEQLRNELTAYYNEYKNSKKDVIIIAISGNFEDIPDNFEYNSKNIPIYTTSWEGISCSVQNMKSKFTETNKQVYENIIKKFEEFDIKPDIFDCISANILNNIPTNFDTTMDDSY